MFFIPDGLARIAAQYRREAGCSRRRHRYAPHCFRFPGELPATVILFQSASRVQEEAVTYYEYRYIRVWEDLVGTMFWHGAAALSLATASLFGEASSQVVTITEYASVCSAVYTMGSQSVIVVSSTVVVQPQQWNDQAANSGTPFVLQVVTGSGSSRKRQAPSATWIMANGNTTMDSTKAAHYQISQGQLSDGNGHYVSMSSGVAYEPFALSSTTGSTLFFVQDSVLYWADQAFTDGGAMFFEVPDILSNAEIVARFTSAADPSWTQVTLKALPGNSLHILDLAVKLTRISDLSRTVCLSERASINVCGDEYPRHLLHGTHRTNFEPFDEYPGHLIHDPCRTNFEPFGL